MKKIILQISLLFICFYSSGQLTLAIVDKSNDISIFIKSRPANEYEVLGKINMPEVVWNGKAAEMIRIGVRRCAKQYPKANGIMFLSAKLGDCQAIEIKETKELKNKKDK